MPLISRQQGPIAIYGATGYTGRLVTAELAEAGAALVISGRSRGKLDALAAETHGDVAVKEATLDDPSSLRSLLADCAVVVDCAGPFVRFGEPVLAAAVETRTHYLDTTGEQPYMKLAFERYGPGASDAEIAVIPAMGFDYVPGDMIASLTAQGMGDLDEISLHYCWEGFIPSQGTARTTVEIISDPGIEWRDGIWQKAQGGVNRGSYEFPAPIGRRGMVRYPAGEQITVPRHIRTENVRTSINASAFASERIAPLFALLMRPAGLAMRTPLKRLAQAALSRLPEGPTPAQRDRMRSMIVCEARRGEIERRGVISCKDVYGLTAAAIRQGAVIAAGRGFDARGALAPSQAFEPKDFLEGLSGFDVRWNVEAVETPLPVEA
ncbi:MAG TPA: saccharopine dehydrogenase NADP-binding domain-containing protein [Solirubrobacterales bacterium]|nr:saccharopine dehydrogenase NADP-binding domain-containing protein [Solirubrobacterales bacterium]